MINQEFSYFIFFWLHCAVCGILVLQLGITPAPCALEAGVLTTGPPGKSLQFLIECPLCARNLASEKEILTLSLSLSIYIYTVLLAIQSQVLLASYNSSLTLDLKCLNVSL